MCWIVLGRSENQTKRCGNVRKTVLEAKRNVPETARTRCRKRSENGRDGNQQNVVIYVYVHIYTYIYIYIYILQKTFTAQCSVCCCLSLMCVCHVLGYALFTLYIYVCSTFYGHQGAPFLFICFLCLPLAVTRSSMGYLFWVGQVHVGATFFFGLASCPC